MKPFAKPLIWFTLAAGLVACSRPVPQPEPIRAVRTLVVQPTSSAGSTEFAAEVRARTESRLAFRVTGKLIARPAEVGQRVQAGQVLARLDATDLQLGQQAAQAGAQAAQAAYALAQAEFKRYQDLRSQGFISALELERRETTLKAQKAQLDQALAQQSVQGNQTAYAALSASAAGVITAVEAEVGAVLAVGTPVLRMAHDGPRDVVFAVPEDVVAAIRPLLGRPGALLARPWGAKAPLPATLREVAAAADPSPHAPSWRRPILARPSSNWARPSPSSSISHAPRLSCGSPAVAALVQANGHSAVWVLDRASMTVRPQPVVVESADGNSLVLAAGLSGGETVVTAGVHLLSPGQKVKLYEAPPAVPASQASR